MAKTAAMVSKIRSFDTGGRLTPELCQSLHLDGKRLGFQLEMVIGIFMESSLSPERIAVWREDARRLHQNLTEYLRLANSYLDREPT